MAVVVMPREEFKRIVRARQRMGGDRHDEVWDGVYVISPEADNVHQKLAGKLFSAFKSGLPDT